MAIVIMLNLVHNGFDTITASLLEIDVKTIGQIQSIFQLKEVNNLSKQTIRDIGNLIMTFKNKNKLKKKANNNNKYYNYHKLSHFEQNYSLLDKKLNKNI